MPKQRLRLDGQTVTKDDIKNKILDELRVHKRLTRQELAQKLGGRDASQLQKDYLKPLMDENKIRKIDGSHYYALVNTTITKAEIKQELYEKTEVFNTDVFKNWGSKITAKRGEGKRIRIARLCIGKVNKKFKINPDVITKDNWKDIIAKMRDALLEAQRKPKHPIGRLDNNSRQALRHLVMYGLEKETNLEIDQKTGEELGIDGHKPKPKSATLHIKKEQIEQLKQILLLPKYDSLWFVKCGVKLWTGVRPSTLYIIETDKLEFYDRKVEYIEIHGKRFTNESILEFAKILVMSNPQLAETIKIQSYMHRACTFEVFENKQQKDYRKFIYDEEFVIALEKYHKQRKFEKKKYLFWNDNQTAFDKINYDDIVRNAVENDNDFFKEVLLQVGFTASDFGHYFRANYGFRHFAIQVWLIATDYNYDKVAEMFHETSETLKTWYGRPIREHAEKMFSGVVA